MIVKEVPSVYSDEIILEAECEYCGAKIYVNEPTFLRWKRQGLKIKCECGAWI